MPDGDKNIGGSLVFDFRKWWRHMKTIYTIEAHLRDRNLVNHTLVYLLSVTR